MNYKELIPKNTFIYDYLSYCSCLETAKSFDFWSAIWILSMICNRNIKINRPNSPIYPNFYILFVANSGIARKSTAVSQAKNIIDKIYDNEYNMNIISSKTTKQKLEYSLTEQSTINNCCIFGINCSEFITFYKNTGIIEILTDLYDCPDERSGYGSVSNGDIKYNNVFVSSLCGSTPNYFYKAISKDEIEGGFTSRNIIIYEEFGKKRIAWADEQKSDENIIKKGKIIKENLNTIKRSVTLSSQGLQRYTQWYKTRRLSSDIYLRSFESREQDHILKLALLLAINECDGLIDREDLILKKHIDLAIKIIKEIKHSAYKFINNSISFKEKSTMDRVISRIIDVIHTAGNIGIKHRDLYMKVHNSCSLDEFLYIINSLHELELIEKLQPYNSKAIFYRETKNLLNFNYRKLINIK